MDSSTVLENQTILIENNEIVALDASSNITLPATAKIIDGTGKFLLPGFINMYTHVNESNLMLYLATGQTTVRDLPSHINVLGLREDIKKGEIVGPNILAYGLRATGAPAPYHTQQPIFTVEQGKEQVREAKRLGYDGMFIYATCKPETYNVILDEAEKLNFPISGHFPIFIDEDEVMNSKQMEFDNLTGLTRRGELTVDKSRLIQALKKHNKAITPSLAVHHSWSIAHKEDSLYNSPNMDYVPNKLRINWRPDETPSSASSNYNYKNVEKLIKELSDNNIQLFLGSDGGYPLIIPGFAYLDEMELFSKAGIDNFKILKYATVDAAKFLKLENRGTIEIGNMADIVLLDNNPLKDMENVKGIFGVMVGGKWLDREYLNEQLKLLRAENNSTKNRFESWKEYLAKKETSSELEYTFYNKDTEVGGQKIIIDTLGNRRLGITSVMISDAPDYRETYSYQSVNRKRIDSLYILNKGSEGITEATLVREGDSIFIDGKSPFHGSFNYAKFAPPGTQLWSPFTSRYFELENMLSYYSAVGFSRRLETNESEQFNVYQIELNSEEFGDSYILDEAVTTLFKIGENDYRLIYPGFSGFSNRTSLPFSISITTNEDNIPIEVSNGDLSIKQKKQ
ncbi:MAG: hypothetical protein Aureis2KO_26630 [Aureisphaera sp.]